MRVRSSGNPDQKPEDDPRRRADKTPRRGKLQTRLTRTARQDPCATQRSRKVSCCFGLPCSRAGAVRSGSRACWELHDVYLLCLPTCAYTLRRSQRPPQALASVPVSGFGTLPGMASWRLEHEMKKHAAYACPRSLESSRRETSWPEWQVSLTMAAPAGDRSTILHHGVGPALVGSCRRRPPFCFVHGEGAASAATPHCTRAYQARRATTPAS